jgi:hypothetical protein
MRRVLRKTAVLAALLAALLTAAGLAGPASAQEPLRFTVRPAIGGLSPEAQEREARLERRMRENEFLFRSICKGCGALSNQLATDAPFDPVGALTPLPRDPPPPAEPREESPTAAVTSN